MELTNKRVTIQFDDKSGNNISRKDGLCLDDNNYAITIRNTAGFIEKIPYYRIIRIIEIPEGMERNDR